jgi:hypothetical protein
MQPHASKSYRAELRRIAILWRNLTGVESVATIATTLSSQ